MNKQKNIIIRVDEQLKKRLEAVAEREAVNLSALIRNFLKDWLREKEGETAINIEAFFSEWEEDHELNGELVRGCITYPVTIEILSGLVRGDHEVRVVTYNVDRDGNHNTVHLSDELSHGALHIPVENYDYVAPILKRHGYEVSEVPVDEDWLRHWERGIDLDEYPDCHWHFAARIVQFLRKRFDPLSQKKGGIIP